MTATASSPTEVGTSTLPGILLDRARTTPDRTALRRKDLGVWNPISWSTYADMSARVGLGLRALGVGHGDKVAIHSENRPEWVYADMGTQGVGGVAVGVYPTSAATELEYLLNHSEAKVLIAEDEEQLDKALEVRERCPHLGTIVVLERRGTSQHLGDPAIIHFDDLVALGSETPISEFEHSVRALDPGSVALIVYTSGTTGPPKGAMTSHANLAAAAATSLRSFEVSEGDEILSYLPLCHIAERLISVVNGVSHGYIVNFGENSATFPTDMAEVQPTFLLGVPRVWEKMLAGIQIRMQDASRAKRLFYDVWLKQGEKIAAKRMRSAMSPIDRVLYAIGNVLVYRHLKTKLGLGRCTAALSGAAPIAPQVLAFFWALGVPIREGYGQTENTAQATVNPDGDVRLGTVGTVVSDVELKIADDGEILTRGPHIFVGYFKNEEATAETVDADGWLHTGDVGELDADGYLKITDRKKDIIITAGGKNISPSEIENALKVSPYVREAVVIGDRRKYLTALIGIELDTVGAWATAKRIPYTTYDDLASKDEVHELISGVVDETNTQFAQVETIKKFTLLRKELDADDGELTATQKVKRKAIGERFADEIEAMY